jgi:glycerol-3-phosphate acyltransferase PlsY
MALWVEACVILLGYLIGSIPFGYIVAKKVKGIDIREHGSGNVGATNVKRVVGNKAGLTVLILDFLKAFAPVLALRLLIPGDGWLPVLTALAILVGHSRSIFIKFSGGKAAISGLGAYLALEPLGGIILAVFAFSLIKITRVVSIGSMTTALLSVVVMWFLHQNEPSYVTYAVISTLYVIYLHKANIMRLLQGSENRL